MVTIINEVAEEWADLVGDMLEEYYGLADADRKALKAQLMERMQGILSEPDTADAGLKQMQAEGYSMDKLVAAMMAEGVE